LHDPTISSIINAAIEMQLVGIIVRPRFAIEIDYQLTVIVQIHSGVENPAADAMPCPSVQAHHLVSAGHDERDKVLLGRAVHRPVFSLDRIKRSKECQPLP
jgi:hypothetical protein